MAAVSKAPGLPSSGLNAAPKSLTTLPDPRSPDEFPSPRGSSSNSSHTDLSSEVATLSNKLISAINHQTNLDDSLAATRLELEASQEHIRQLELDNNQHARLISSGALVKRADVEEQASKLVAKLAEERKRRTVVEKDKKGIEQELENLTTALFEEANQMVAAARKEQEAAERRTDQLRAQLNDTESLLASHQDQLAELKNVMEKMNSGHHDLELATNGSTAPSTPAPPTHGVSSRTIGSRPLSPLVPEVSSISPAPPSSFCHLFSPVLRTDLQSYEDFRSLMQISRKPAPGIRVNSAIYNGSTAFNVGHLQPRMGISQSGRLPSSGSTTSLPTPDLSSDSLVTAPSTPASSVLYGSSPGIPLKETRFYKRALIEDIEPTLRLDTAPGLSWLVRRNIIPSMCEGNLVVEPMLVSKKLNIFSCALCGEDRNGDEFARTHRFRTSENENSQRYPLCTYCVNRVRAACDYLGFLRMVKDGHWRTDGAEAERAAWKESVRLRERMFWARIGGGVIPVFIPQDSPRVSMDVKPGTPFSAPPVMHRPLPDEKRICLEENRAPVGSILLPGTGPQVMHHGPEHEKNEDKGDIARETARVDDTALSPSAPLHPYSEQLPSSLRESLRLRPRSRATFYERDHATARMETQHASTTSGATTVQPAGDKGLQITIPTGFN